MLGAENCRRCRGGGAAATSGQAVDDFDGQIDNEVTLRRFARAVVAGGAAFVVVGADGVAGVPSQRDAGVTVDLMWSSRAEADRWADALTENPEILALDLATLIGSYLPDVQGRDGRIGADWSDGPDEVEFDAASVIEALRDAALTDFDEAVAIDRHVWLLRRDSGPGGHAVLSGAHERLAVPIFASREAAEAAARELWPDAVAVRQSIGEFTQRTLYTDIEHKLVYAPGFVAGRSVSVLMPWDVKSRLQALLRRELRAVA